MVVRPVAAWLLLIAQLASARADTLPISRFQQGCTGVAFEAVEQAISDAGTCAISAEIFRICTGNDAYGLKRQFASALEERCSKDFEGKLRLAEQVRYERVLAKCGEGLRRPDGRTSNTAEAVEAKCRAEAAVAWSREFVQSAPLVNR